LKDSWRYYCKAAGEVNRGAATFLPVVRKEGGQLLTCGEFGHSTQMWECTIITPQIQKRPFAA
jgi:hypothetical protein